MLGEVRSYDKDMNLKKCSNSKCLAVTLPDTVMYYRLIRGIMPSILVNDYANHISMFLKVCFGNLKVYPSSITK